MKRRMSLLPFLGDVHASQGLRMMEALFIVAVSLAVVSVSSYILEGFHGATSGMRMATSVARYSMAADDSQRFQDFGDEAEGLILELFTINAGVTDVMWGQVPEGFVDEFFDPIDLSCSNVVHAPGTVGMICGGDGKGVRKKTIGLMQDKGWIVVPETEEDHCVTFVKEKGQYRWAYITCSEISGTVTVSVSFQSMEEVDEV